MRAPSVEETLMSLPDSVKPVKSSTLTGFRKWVFNLSKPAGQCFGSIMAIEDSVWDEAHLSEEKAWYFYSLVQHELRHHYQSKGWLLPFFVIGYVLLPLPVGFSFRALFELGGFRETLRCFDKKLRAQGLYSIRAVEDESLRLAKKFREKFYGWMGWFLPTKFWVWALMRGLNK